MKFGNLQRRWQENKPQVYNKETRIVCLDIVKENQTVTEGEETVVKEGFSFIPIEIDTQIDYGHIKSQLIEAGFAQKDEFGLLMNAVDSIIKSAKSADTWTAFKDALAGEDDAQTFIEFCEFRSMCAEAAKEVMKFYNKLVTR